MGYPAFSAHPRYVSFLEVDEDLLRAHWNADVDADLLRVLHCGYYDCTGRVEPRPVAAGATRNLRRLIYGILFSSPKRMMMMMIRFFFFCFAELSVFLSLFLCFQLLVVLMMTS